MTTPKLDMEQAAEPLDIAAARAICKKAYASCGVSPPPWRVVNAQRFMHYRIIDVEGSEVISGDAAHPHGLLTFIAFARQALPAALDRVEELERTLAAERKFHDESLDSMSQVYDASAAVKESHRLVELLDEACGLALLWAASGGPDDGSAGEQIADIQRAAKGTP